MSFGTGALTGGAGLWNIPSDAAPGVVNFANKLFLNNVIGSGSQLAVDAIYEYILVGECGWINWLEWIF